MLALYGAVLLLVIPYHELWADEAQAWLIARDSSAWQIVRYRLHYEGAPALWHLTLHVFHRLHGTYPDISYLGAAFALAGMLVFLRWSPFPLILRVLIPFTFFMQYQYAVISRSYVMFPLLVFTLCILYTRPKRIVWFLVTAGLLANLSMQGAVFSSAMVTIFLFDRHHQPADAGVKSRKRWKLAAAIYLPSLTLAGLVALPAPDLNFALQQAPDSPVHSLLLRFPGEPARTQPIPPPDAPLPPEPVPPAPSFRAHPVQWAGWYPYFANCAPDGNCGPQRITQPLLEFVLGCAAQATWPLATFKLLACTFLALVVLWLKQLTFLRGLMPWALLILVGQVLWVADHHAGMLLITLIAALWIARARRPDVTIPPNLDHALILVFALICVLQIHWTIVVIEKEIHSSYDPGPETARWLQAHPKPRMAAFDLLGTSIQAWFPRSPFFNMPNAYWIWSSIDNVNGLHQSTIATHPDLVVMPVQFLEPGLMHNEWAPLSSMTSPSEERNQTRNIIVNDLRANGYRETHRFCGTRWSRLSASYRDCDLIFEPAQGP